MLGVRRDGQKVLLCHSRHGRRERSGLAHGAGRLAARGLRKPDLAIVDGAPGLEKALTSLWADVPLQRCTVHKLRNLIAHAPKKLAEEIAADFSGHGLREDGKRSGDAAQGIHSEVAPQGVEP